MYDSCDLASPIAAGALRIPTVNHSFGSMIPLAVPEPAQEGVAPLWRGEGLEPAPHAGAFRGLYVDLSPRSFAWEQPLALFRPLLDGLDGDVSAVVTVGRGVDLAAFGPVAPRVRVESFVPQAHVLPRCAAVVSHGGSGTTLGALAHGLPLVLVPQGADQFDNAARCLAAGVAVVLGPGELSSEAVREALHQVVLGDPAYTEAARRLAAEIEEMGTPEDVAMAVEARSRRRVAR